MLYIKEQFNILHEKLATANPKMLQQISENCEWLEGKANHEFIFAVAVLSIRMELDGILDKNFDGKIIEPNRCLMADDPKSHSVSSLDSTSADEIFADTAALTATHNKFDEWLNNVFKKFSKEATITASNEDGPSGAPTEGTQAEMYHDFWDGWEHGEMLSVRSIVNNSILIDGVSGIDEQHGVNDRLLCIFVSYAYTQFLIRHFTFPGFIRGDTNLSTLAAVRKVNSQALSEIFRGKKCAELTFKAVYEKKNMLCAESWSLLSSVSGDYGEAGSAAI
jgi:hypothetical protein